MAYVECERCGRTAFTTAYWSNIDYCDHCGAELPHPRSVAQRLTRRAQVRNAHRSLSALWVTPPNERRPAA